MCRGVYYGAAHCAEHHCSPAPLVVIGRCNHLEPLVRMLIDGNEHIY